MRHLQKYGGWVFGLIGVGLALGLWLGRDDTAQPMINLPEIPVQASGVSQADDFLMTTGFVDADIEAVYYLDYLSGNLNAAVLSKRNMAFRGVYSANVRSDLAKLLQSKGIPMPQTPKFMMVTGRANLANVGGMTRAGDSMVYVAETNSGIVMVYGLPNTSSAASNTIENLPLMPWTSIKLGSTPIIRRD